MRIQKSFQAAADDRGKLYVVPTPIGNLEDITVRALRILKEADLVLAEDTRNTGKLLHYFEIKKPMLSYHEHNKLEREHNILDKLKGGDTLALVSDAGMPGISDPGYEIIKAAIEEEISVIVLPGANAALCALIGSGLPTDHFYFYGFLPRKTKDRKAALDYLEKLDITFILYESPHRLSATLTDLSHSLGGDRHVSIARELTKKFEEYTRGTLEELSTWAGEENFKGECCLVVEGKPPETENWWIDLSLKQHVEKIINEENVTSKEAIKMVAKQREIPKREVYQAYHTS
ncbi:16S rRNA (cytidine1402-2'-O)-methyltransferase [Gracilibacillus ureilyticus]|uniref:Ribosomal RNA small subunit methyltransferase I n=1 Tax=Gracilibacillus ureilyticus TaxID=531814 RepID=A0A1H9VN41_9BACI|nr:16S rRNA (cytidine(1402)-2'-O)-methyltransferase [Gracilibacillus ureilyticus]SES23156.1 16S rRNA (cytidine1402-2'-O)-methyltransferase [Gracilibacillus ureilyticus]